MPSAIKESCALLKPFHGLFLKSGHFEKSYGFPCKLSHNKLAVLLRLCPVGDAASLHGMQSVAEQQSRKNSRNLSFFLSVCEGFCFSSL